MLFKLKKTFELNEMWLHINYFQYEFEVMDGNLKKMHLVYIYFNSGLCTLQRLEPEKKFRSGVLGR